MLTDSRRNAAGSGLPHICNFRSRNNLRRRQTITGGRPTPPPKNPLPRKTDSGRAKTGESARRESSTGQTDTIHIHIHRGGSGKGGARSLVLRNATRFGSLPGGWLASTNLAPDPTRPSPFRAYPARRRPWKGGRKKKAKMVDMTGWFPVPAGRVRLASSHRISSNAQPVKRAHVRSFLFRFHFHLAGLGFSNGVEPGPWEGKDN